MEGVNDSLHVLVADNIAFFRTNAVKSVFLIPYFNFFNGFRKNGRRTYT